MVTFTFSSIQYFQDTLLRTYSITIIFEQVQWSHTAKKRAQTRLKTNDRNTQSKKYKNMYVKIDFKIFITHFCYDISRHTCLWPRLAGLMVQTEQHTKNGDSEGCGSGKIQHDVKAQWQDKAQLMFHTSTHAYIAGGISLHLAKMNINYASRNRN